ncbi:hypothetical protein Gdia_0696 [Gluconacetobacter diazotrophicus PA1 5]|nr:hypothetical protein Gdia_0696 [Gluconacetobacter diazotrophicus PA1 5]
MGSSPKGETVIFTVYTLPFKKPDSLPAMTGE